MISPRQHSSEIRKRLEKSGDPIRRARLPKRLRIAMKIADGIDALDWGNKDLADKLGKYSSQISTWLKGDHNFTIDTLSDIEEILGIRLLALDEEDAQNSGTVLEAKVKDSSVAIVVSMNSQTSTPTPWRVTR
jgi:ribosome-binding protein aMBF1 (putative translation factor)